MPEHKLTRPPLWCRLFGHKFRKVFGSNEWAFTGREYEFSHCLRCDAPNPEFQKDIRAIEHPQMKGKYAKPI